ncbi:MAG: glycosyltransferase family 2 protein, partial [Crocinitomicaceae bacterium]|nr:glycosyltransferase family 2 protein [Crocinitomicaceae bacterium]
MISILIPFKNTAPFFRECIDSILEQSHSDFEIIAVDDHSEDDSLDIIMSYSDKRIQVFKNEGIGILPALQTAQKHATGKFITRMDADDVMPKDKLSFLLDALKQKGQGNVATGMVQYFGKEKVSEGYKKYENWINKVCTKNTFYEEIYRECVVASPNWMMHKEDFDLISGFKEIQYPEDYDLVFKWKKAGLQIHGIKQITHLWREHKNRTSRTNIHYQQASFFKLKTSHFLRENKNKNIVLLGAKKKGRIIAKILTSQNIKFRWFEQDEKLIETKVMGVQLLPYNTLISN